MILSLVAFITNANAQSEIKAYGTEAKAGQTIHGIVKDSEGPVRAADVFEVNSKNEVVAIRTQIRMGFFLWNWLTLPIHYSLVIATTALQNVQ